MYHGARNKTVAPAIHKISFVIRIITIDVSPQVGERVMTVAQQLEARGETRGEARAQKTIAKRLLEIGMDIEKVRILTELSLTEKELADA
jgi:predicted transposase YdaD